MVDVVTAYVACDYLFLSLNVLNLVCESYLDGNADVDYSYAVFEISVSFSNVRRELSLYL